MVNQYEVIIIGGGPAGLTAGLYTARARLKTLLIEKMLVGGQIATADLVENFPGFPGGINGMELTARMHEQAKSFGLEILLGEVTRLEVTGESKFVKTTEGDYAARTIIIAGGSLRSKLDAPGEAEYTGRGVSYCATCDGAFFQDKIVAVVGGGNVAVSEAIHLTHYASRVVLIHRRNQLRADRILQEKILADPKIEVRWDSVVTEIRGKKFVETLSLKNIKTGLVSDLPVDGVFISVGLKPETEYLKDLLRLDEGGYIATTERMETEVPGVFAAGDIRKDAGRQAICAAGDGATAAIFAEKFLRG
jgi:thioredoxin reductase (NADPH)